MSIHEAVTAALSAVLANTWLGELPVDPTFPAIVFDIETTPEDQWVQGGGYDQHTVGLVIYAKTQTQIHTLKPQVISALQSIAGYMADGQSGDADYEDDSSLYGWYMNHVIRWRHDEG